MKLFDNFSEELHWMCHTGQVVQPLQKPKSWKPLFSDCISCLGRKTLCTFTAANPPILFWLCELCSRRTIFEEEP